MAYIPLKTVKLFAAEFEKKLKGYTVEKFCHGDDIIWVIGLRSDHRYRVTKDSKAIVKIEIEIKDNY